MAVNSGENSSSAAAMAAAVVADAMINAEAEGNSERKDINTILIIIERPEYSGLFLFGTIIQAFLQRNERSEASFIQTS
jgi:hypothetical protein